MVKEMILMLASIMSKEDMITKMEETLQEYKSSIAPEEKEKAWNTLVYVSTLIQAKTVVGDKDFDKMMEVSKQMDMVSNISNQIKNQS